MKKRTLLFFASFLPAVLLLLVAELIARGSQFAQTSIRTQPFEQELSGLLRHDDQLFWSNRPNLEGQHAHTIVATNSLGLRAREIGPKQPGEFRILSLGESSTFGFGVLGSETYSEVLETLLNAADATTTFSVINAGVSAYSSFQSLRYLELRGLALEPDLILFYHELNDYLPSAVRGSENDEIGLLMTDRQLYESKLHALNRALKGKSALYRFLSTSFVRFRLSTFDSEGFENPVLRIGLSDVAIQSLLVEVDAAGTRSSFRDADQRALGQRVSEEERREILDELHTTCARHGIGLVVIHPAYKLSSRHECVLTEFCLSRGVSMVEAFESLHPKHLPWGHRFLDAMHPNPDGHRALAEQLARFLADRLAGVAQRAPLANGARAAELRSP